MDESSQPVIAVLGHPIAGNPTHFVLERVIDHLGLDHRIVSFDITPKRLGVALDGLDALGLFAVHLDVHLRGVASAWLNRHAAASSASLTDDGLPAQGLPADDKIDASVPRASTEPESSPVVEETPLVDPRWAAETLRYASDEVDCLVRPSSAADPWIGTNQRFDYLAARLTKHFQSRGLPPKTTLMLGDRANRIDFPPEPNRVAAAHVIVLPPASAVSSRPAAPTNSTTEVYPLAADDWPPSDGRQLVLDFWAGGHPEAVRLRKRGYTVVGPTEQQIGELIRCVRIWTGRDVSIDLISDAVEEYLAV